MIIQFVLTAGLAGCLIYAYLQKDRSGVASGAIGTVSVVGCFFVWFPDMTSRIAAVLGVGRGADLILYCWVVISMFIALNLHLKLKGQTAAITELARWIALSRPIDPRGPGPAA